MGAKKQRKKGGTKWKDYCYSKISWLKSKGSNLKKILKKVKCRCH